MASSADMNNTEDSFNAFGGIAFDQRKANAVRAYFEWMPIRQVDLDDNLRYLKSALTFELTVAFGETFRWVRCWIWSFSIQGIMTVLSLVFSLGKSLRRFILEYGVYF